MKALVIAGLLGSTLLASGAIAQSPAPGATQASPAANSSQFMTQLSPDTMLLSDLMDEDVMGADNDDMGEIEDVVLDRNGRVAALVVEIDEGIGDRTVALPMSAFRLDAEPQTTGSVRNPGQSSGTSAARSDDMRIMLNMPLDQLKSAPEFDDD